MLEWSSPRLLCIAGDFTKYDGHAVQQINRNIELLRYLRFGEELLLLELVNAVQAKDGEREVPIGRHSCCSTVTSPSRPAQSDRLFGQVRKSPDTSEIEQVC